MKTVKKGKPAKKSPFAYGDYHGGKPGLIGGQVAAKKPVKKRAKKR